MDRAMSGDIDDVGLGVLFGLENYRYEFAGLMMHAEHLEAAFGVGPHTISVPRVKPAHGVDPGSFDGGISVELFAKLAACIRIAVPYTGMIKSPREGKSVREKLRRRGVSQISGASRTSVGGYAEGSEESPEEDTRQFEVSDTRSLDEVIKWLIDMDYVPSFCTACYRAGRTGDRFMELCKSKQILNCCHPNALMTLKEYLMDYAGPETFKAGGKLIEKEIGTIPKDGIRDLVRANLTNIENGQRDFRL
jgi:2-iminoacetate synthase